MDKSCRFKEELDHLSYNSWLHRYLRHNFRQGRGQPAVCACVDDTQVYSS